MNGFEEFSTETRKIIKDEAYICAFIEKDKENETRMVLPDVERDKTEVCKECFLDKICKGIDRGYSYFFGKEEVFPVFKDSNKIIDKIKNG